MPNNIPTVATPLDAAKLDPLLDKLEMRGLSYKQRRFIFLYVGDAAAAALEAGYCQNYKHKAHQRAALCRVISHLMKNPQIQRNIALIQRELESFGVMGTAEAKMIISELARTSANERVRMEASKLCLQWEGALSERMMIQQHTIEDKNITVILKSHTPTTPEEQAEYDRLEKAIAEDQRLELAAMGKAPDVIETSNTEPSGDDLLMTNRR